MISVLCLGIATQDHVYGVPGFPTTGEKHRAHSVEIVGGGIAANASVAVARLGGRALLASRLGEDSTGRNIIEALEAEGVDCSLCRRFPGLKSSSSAVLVDGAGERMVINYADPGIPDDPSWLPADLPRGVQSVMADTRWQAGALRMFGAARAAGAFGVLDGDRAPENRELLSAATHLVFAMQAAREMTGHDDALQAIRAFPAPDHVSLAITDGVRGTYLRQGREIIVTPAFPVTAVDTLGAGDVFHGAFAYALAAGMDELQAIRFSSATAAIKCTRFGGRAGAPRLAEVEAFLRERA
ncbi:PfkB family carbohydrate kinase [Terrarubrum flagellatum]|uniref:PfkB family carbohydrate kinase n=1 Tax=Terrirubrum flagellatum TaxID=2895980 RepID=UPI00314528E3